MSKRKVIFSDLVSKSAKIRNRYNQVPHLKSMLKFSLKQIVHAQMRCHTGADPVVLERGSNLQRGI